MSWDYNYQVGPEGGPYVDLLDYCVDVRLVSEIDVQKQGTNVNVPFIDGEYSDPFKFRTAGVLMLDCMLRYTNPSGAVTHTDGAAGHVFENLNALKALLGGNRLPIVLRRTAPHMGAVEAVGEYIGGVVSAGPRMRFVFPIRMLEGSWREQTTQTFNRLGFSSQNTANINSLDGDAEVGDANVTITCKGAGDDPSIEINPPGDKITFVGSFALNDVLIANLRTHTFTLNGANAHSMLERTNGRAWYFRLNPAIDPSTLRINMATGTWDFVLNWNNRWL